MNSIIIMTPPTVSFRDLERTARDRWTIAEAGADRILIEGDRKHVYLSFDNDFKNSIHDPEMCSRQLVESFDRASDAAFYFLDYSDRQFAAQVVRQIANSPNFMIDDGSGMVVTGDVFANLVDQGGWK